MKSVHIEGYWPYQYIAPERGKPKVISQASKDRANARKREIYHQKKKLLGLQVFSMSCDELDIDICTELNNATKR